MRLAVLGAGRVGIPTAASLARFGHHVVVGDIEGPRIEALSRGSVPFHEPGLQQLVEEAMAAGRLQFTTEGAVAGARAVFVCVGTPPAADGAADLSSIDATVEEIARSATDPTAVVIKSTVPVGTVHRVAARLAEVQLDGRFSVVANPEFLREGKAVEDALRPFRILVGTDDAEGRALMREVYAPLIRIGIRWIETDPATAEVAKHACNSFLALKVSYVNAVARVCEAAGADVGTVAEAMGVDERIGPAYLQAGLGYGGYCLPKDVQAFERSAAQLGYEFGLLREADRVNTEAVDAALAKVFAAVRDPAGKRVALLGLSFKPGTDNVAGAPALALARRLLDAGATVVGYDPHAGDAASAALPGLEVADDPYRALEGAHCAILCTEWEELLGLDPDRIRGAMAEPVVVDGRNALDGDLLVKAGFTYLPTGRPARP